MPVTTQNAILFSLNVHKGGLALPLVGAQGHTRMLLIMGTIFHMLKHLEKEVENLMISNRAFSYAKATLTKQSSTSTEEIKEFCDKFVINCENKKRGGVMGRYGVCC